MRVHRCALPALFCYAGIAVVAFGAILAETIVIYPNIFHDVPASLAASMDFFVVAGPADFFPSMGALTVGAAAVALLLSWRRRQARWWVAASMVSLVLGEFLFSMVFFWPRNEIMFDEGLAMHSVEVIRQAAVEFETGHWARLAMSGVTATLASIGSLRSYRESVLLSVWPEGQEVAA